MSRVYPRFEDAPPHFLKAAAMSVEETVVRDASAALSADSRTRETRSAATNPFVRDAIADRLTEASREMEWVRF